MNTKKIKNTEKVCGFKKKSYVCMAFEGELSSVGSEHLPYKQRVDGSNPSVPTKRAEWLELFPAAFFICFHFCPLSVKIMQNIVF